MSTDCEDVSIFQHIGHLDIHETIMTKPERVNVVTNLRISEKVFDGFRDIKKLTISCNYHDEAIKSLEDNSLFQKTNLCLVLSLRGDKAGIFQ